MFSTVSRKSFASIYNRFVDILPETRERLVKVRRENGNKVLGAITIEQVIGGMRSIKGLLTETSRLDANKGIKFRGLSLPECQIRLPSVKREPIPEAILYLLITGEVPSNEEVETLKNDLAQRASTFPESAEKIINSLSSDLHPMSQLSIGVLALQTESKFAKAYRDGVNKYLYWESALEDCLDLVARIPKVAALIYRNKYRDRKLGEISPNGDLSENFCRMLGYNDESFWELIRLYLTIHCDHEGGNVSAHATHLVGSALSDLYLSYSAGLNGLAGPLHGLANQECLKFMLKMQEEVGNNATEAEIEKFVKDTLAKGLVIPGYGHAVLRVTDPRFVCQMEFAQRYMPDDPLCKLIANLYKVAPRVLKETGKVSNPFPNVDAHSGALLTHFGMTEFDFYTVLFGVSRAIGCGASYVWSRALALPIERPGSVTMENLEDFVRKSS
jgi:citrate synthase